MNNNTFTVTNYHQRYAAQTVEMWRNSKEQAIGQKEIHSFDSHVYFLNHLLPKEYKIELAITHNKVVGMIAYNQWEISQLYIHLDFQRKGIGEVLLDRAKQQSSGRLRLYTFEINERAKKFYEKHGFKVISQGHENEENLPDIQYEWVTV